MNNNIDTILITQIDYVKCLIEEQRLGEALQCIENVSKDLSKYCDEIAQRLSTSDFFLSKEQLKTKKGNYIYVNDTWCKVIDRTPTTIELAVSEGVSVIKTIKKSKIKINDISHA